MRHCFPFHRNIAAQCSIRASVAMLVTPFPRMKSSVTNKKLHRVLPYLAGAQSTSLTWSLKGPVQLTDGRQECFSKKLL